MPPEAATKPCTKPHRPILLTYFGLERRDRCLRNDCCQHIVPDAVPPAAVLAARSAMWEQDTGVSSTKVVPPALAFQSGLTS
jgi:hypothetical protein